MDTDGRSYGMQEVGAGVGAGAGVIQGVVPGVAYEVRPGAGVHTAYEVRVRKIIVTRSRVKQQLLREVGSNAASKVRSRAGSISRPGSGPRVMSGSGAGVSSRVPSVPLSKVWSGVRCRCGVWPEVGCRCGVWSEVGCRCGVWSRFWCWCVVWFGGRLTPLPTARGELPPLDSQGVNELVAHKPSVSPLYHMQQRRNRFQMHSRRGTAIVASVR